MTTAAAPRRRDLPGLPDLPGTPSATWTQDGFALGRIPAFRDNYIWLIGQAGGSRTVAVDPGEAEPLERLLDARGLSLAAILLTHHHADHVGGVARLLERFPGIPVFGPALESITGVTRPLAGDETLDVPGLPVPLRVLAVPGHTRGHLAYYLEPGPGAAPGLLFCGDTLFGLGCGRLFEGSPGQMHASLVSLAALPENTLVFCAHEYTLLNLPFAEAVDPYNAVLAQRGEEIRRLRARGEATVPMPLALERATNPFLRCAEPALAAAVADMAPDGDPVAVFAALREWRNRW